MIAFRDSIGRSFVVGSIEPQFRFVGQELPDASENSGPLFGGEPPRITVADNSWENVGTIVLGVEGSAQGRWRMAFKPNPALAEQDMPAQIVTRKAGWYFVRFYDLQNELIDSMDFRFAAGLQKIKTQLSNPFPPATGHEATMIEFQHDPDWCVAQLSAGRDCLEIQRTRDKTILHIPPAQQWDRTTWLLGPRGGPYVEVTIMSERVWWAVSNVHAPPLQWQDTCLPLSREDFSATSEEALWFRLPAPRWTDGVFVGFQPDKRREYVPKVTETTISIALRDFSDSQEIEDRNKDHLLRLWTSVNGAFHEAAVATVPSEVGKKTLNVRRVRACQLASALTVLSRTTRGPLRQLLKEVRRQYRRSRRSTADHNIDFVKQALCVIAVFLQLADARRPISSKCANRWRSRVRLASHQFPEIMRQVWRRCRELES